MPLAPGFEFSPYEIAALLGVAGMGEAHRARGPGRAIALGHRA